MPADLTHTSRSQHRRSPSSGLAPQHRYRPYQPERRWGDSRRGWRQNSFNHSNSLLEIQYDRFGNGRRRDARLHLSPSRDANAGRPPQVTSRSELRRPGQQAPTPQVRNANYDGTSRHQDNQKSVHMSAPANRALSPRRLQRLLRIEEEYNKMKSAN
jgi:hypothetical protein